MNKALYALVMVFLIINTSFAATPKKGNVSTPTLAGVAFKNETQDGDIRLIHELILSLEEKNSLLNRKVLELEGEIFKLKFREDVRDSKPSQPCR